MQKAYIAAQTRWMEFKSNAQDEGAGLTEYLLLVALIALGVIAAATVFRNSISDLFNEESTTINGL